MVTSVKLLALFVICIAAAQNAEIPKWFIKRLSRNKKVEEQFLRLAEKGLRKGLSECRRRFRWDKWNCNFSKHVVSKILKRKFIPKVTKEIAFMNAITSAAVALQFASACHRGELQFCCGLPLAKAFKMQTNDQKETEDKQTRFGLWMTEYFTDIAISTRKERRNRVLAIHHNNKIGRNVVKHMAKRFCRCHGTSGTCVLKTCAGHLPTLKQVGTTMKYLYKLAYQGKVDRNQDLQPVRHEKGVDLTDVLVYLSKSPDYCAWNKSQVSVGTVGRVCRIPFQGSTRGAKGHCNELCYSCGYTIKHEERIKKVKCNCKFRWCCEVVCSTCYQKEEVIVCHKR